MKKFIVIVIAILFVFDKASAQKFFTKNGKAAFFSKTSLENIKAENNQVLAVVNTATGELQFSLLMKGFHFEKALMEEHFNGSDYLESDKYPKSTFKGRITDLTKVDFTKDGTYPVPVSGDLQIHGITKSISTSGTITIANGTTSANATFNVAVADYGIKIPGVAKDNIAKTVEVSVACKFDQKM